MRVIRSLLDFQILNNRFNHPIRIGNDLKIVFKISRFHERIAIGREKTGRLGFLRPFQSLIYDAVIGLAYPSA